MQGISKIIQKCSCKKSLCTNYWTEEEDQLLLQKAVEYKAKHWKLIAQYFQNRSPQSCSFRWKKIKNSQNLNLEEKFTQELDEMLISLVEKYGFFQQSFIFFKGQKWFYISKFFQNKSNKQIRERYLNKLRPEINKGKFTEEEDQKLYHLCLQNGNHWKLFGQLMNRSENNIKNRFYSCIIKRNQTDFIQEVNQININPLLNKSDSVEDLQKQDNSNMTSQFINTDYFFATDEEQVIEF